MHKSRTRTFSPHLASRQLTPSSATRKRLLTKMILPTQFQLMKLTLHLSKKISRSIVLKELNTSASLSSTHGHMTSIKLILSISSTTTSMKKSCRILALSRLVSSGFQTSSANLLFQLMIFSKPLENHGKPANLTTATMTCFLFTKLLLHKLTTSFQSMLMTQKLLNLLAISQSITNHSIQSQIKLNHTLGTTRALNGSRICLLDLYLRTNHTSHNLPVCQNFKVFTLKSFLLQRELRLLTCSAHLSNVSLIKLRLTN